MTTLTTRCAIVGGGPAGIMLGYLLARGGVDAMVLEKHADFLRDFRGDTIHPSTLGLMNELGLLDRFLQLPHGTITTLSGTVGGEQFTFADFTHLPEPMNKLVIMPQWDFLEFLTREGEKSPHFALQRRWAATGLIEQNGRVVGVKADTPDGPVEIEADLVVGCDGRHSTLREAARLTPKDIGAPMDILWFRLPRAGNEAVATGGYFDQGAILVLIDRGDHWQCGFVIPKGGDAQVRAAGLDAFRQRIAAIEPKLQDRLSALASMDDVKLLTVGVDRLEKWFKPGLLFIGDAAHTMSPVGGVGINLAVQDAVAAANLLVGKFRTGAPTDADLAAVQERREFPAKATQAVQVFIQQRIIARVLHKTDRPHVPFLLRALTSTEWFRRIPARAVGMGVRPEHISPEILSPGA